MTGDGPVLQNEQSWGSRCRAGAKVGRSSVPVVPCFLMAQQNSEDARPARERKKSEKQAAVDGLRNQRTKKLEAANSAVARLQDELRAVKKLTNRRDALVSHLGGFYQEIDKLTKGKTLLPVTPLMVEQANDIIRDAKEVVTDDTYLDRIKEFVPAGDNPPYPDVLVVMRGVRDSLKRGEGQLQGRRSHLADLLTEARTISVALRLNVVDGEEIVLKEDVEEQLGEEGVAAAWFPADENGDEGFDFDDVDTRDIDSYLSRSSDDDWTQDNDEQDSEQGDEEEGIEPDEER